MSPKAGTPVSLAAPATPAAAHKAATATAGSPESIARSAAAKAATTTTSTLVGSGSDSAAATPPPAEPHQPDKTKKGWIEIVLKDEEGTPKGGTRYRVTLPDGTAAEGTLDAKGHARVEGFDPGTCKITFPELDEKTWKEK